MPLWRRLIYLVTYSLMTLVVKLYSVNSPCHQRFVPSLVKLSGHSSVGLSAGERLRLLTLHLIASLGAKSAALFPGISMKAGIHRIVT